MARSLAAKLVGAGLFLISSLAQAAPPAEADGSLSWWFESLKQPLNGLPCCSISDCRTRTD